MPTPPFGFIISIILCIDLSKLYLYNTEIKKKRQKDELVFVLQYLVVCQENKNPVGRGR